MSKIIKRSLLLVLSLCFVLPLGYFALFSPVKVQRVDAADNTFEMVEGASIKLMATVCAGLLKWVQAFVIIL